MTVPELQDVQNITVAGTIMGKMYSMAHPALLLLLLPVSAFLLQGSPELQPLATLGVGGAIASLVLVFYRWDRKASEDRYAVLALDFRKVITENTAAMTKLTLILEQDHRAR